MQITGNASSKGLQPYIQVDSGSLGIPTVALIDTGADTNTISYALWEKLGKPSLATHQLILTGFAEQEVHMLGKCSLPVYMFGYKCTHEFFVFRKIFKYADDTGRTLAACISMHFEVAQGSGQDSGTEIKASSSICEHGSSAKPRALGGEGRATSAPRDAYGNSLIFSSL